MPRISAAETGGKNLLAFLDMLAWSEDAPAIHYSKDDGYDVVVGGIESPNTFGNYTGRPNILVKVTRDALKPAADCYEMLFRRWKPYRDMPGPKGFSPSNQGR